jgi:hypothetical protein
MGKLKTPLFLTGIFSDLDGKFINFKKNICKIEWVKEGPFLSGYSLVCPKT